MVGISRFKITDHWDGTGKWRKEEAEKCWLTANRLYREIFTDLNMPLLVGEETIECTHTEFEAGYDYQLGIDVILRPQNQGEVTMQEKFLFTDFGMITVEHCQDWLTLEKGDWYKLKVQYYFVGYANGEIERQYTNLNPWMLLDWSRLGRATAQGHVNWKLRSNDWSKDGARASFMYVKFEDVPPEVIAASSIHAYSYF